jgi:hypothetical protein
MFGEIKSTYQQVNIEPAINNIFMLFMRGYFAKKEYVNCFKTFMRYKKNTKGKYTYTGNDFVIHRYYYLAKWLVHPKPLYLKRIDELMEEFNGTSSYRKVCAVWNDIVEYFNLPVEKKPIPSDDVALSTINSK